ERHAGAGEWCEVIDRIAGVPESLGLGGEAILPEEKLPVPRAVGPGALAAGPASEVTHRRVAIDAGHAVGIRDGPVVAVEAAAAESHEGRPGCEPVAGRQVRIEGIPMF